MSSQTAHLIPYSLVFTRLLPHASRWHSLSILAEEQHDMQQILRFLVLVAFPALKMLSLNTDLPLTMTGDAAVAWSGFSPFAASLPALESLYNEATCIDWRVESFQSLTKLTLVESIPLYSHTADQFFDAIESCPKLTDLHVKRLYVVRQFDGDSDSSSKERQIVLPQLANLTLDLFDADFFANFTTVLALPLLRTLDMSLGDEGTVSVEFDFNEGLQNLANVCQGRDYSSLHSVEALRLEYEDEAHEGLVAALKQLNRVRVLVANCSYSEPPISDDLTLGITSLPTGDPAHHPILPSLTTFVCSGMTAVELKGLVNVRRAAGVPLKKLFVPWAHKCHNYRLTEEDVTWFSENVSVFGFFSVTVRPDVGAWEYSWDLEQLLEIDSEPPESAILHDLCKAHRFLIPKNATADWRDSLEPPDVTAEPLVS